MSMYRLSTECSLYTCLDLFMLVVFQMYLVECYIAWISGFHSNGNMILCSQIIANINVDEDEIRHN